MRKSYALRLAAAFAGIGIASAALTAILVNVAFSARFNDYLQQQQQSREQQIVSVLADSYLRNGRWRVTDLRTVVPMVMMAGGTIRLVDASGNTVPIPHSASSRMISMHRGMTGSSALGSEQRLPVVVDGTRVGTAIVRLPALGVLPHDAEFRYSVNRLLFFGGIAAGLLALLVGIFLAGRAVAPVRELSEASRAIAAGDRGRRVRHDSPDEFGDMARSFNAMADAVQEQERLRKTFGADVAHEVRTPLAILRSQIEAIQDGVMELSAETLDSLHEEVLRIGRLVADLETLSSADAAGFSLQKSHVALSALLEESAGEFAGPFEAEGVALETDLDAVSASVDPARIRQVVGNLLSNALKFTPRGGHVRLELAAEADWAVIRVRDSGRGIHPDDLPQVFDRFFRGRDTRAGGSGIGLTVARDIVEAHGGVIEAQNAPGSGTTFTIRLPHASAPPLLQPDAQTAHGEAEFASTSSASLRRQARIS